MLQKDLIEVDIGRIKVNPLNPRRHQGQEYARLKASIEAIGIIVPPIVRVMPAAFWEVVDGEGRVHVAKEIGLEKIQVLTIGVADDEVALTMLQASNSVRTFGLLAECRGVANLHRKGQTGSKLAKETGRKEVEIYDMIAIGYFPAEGLNLIEADIAKSEERALVWTFSLLAAMLPLRELRAGVTVQSGKEWHSLDTAYSYQEVITAIKLVSDRQILTVRDMKAYVSQRRYEIYEARFDKEVQRRLAEELEQAKAELKQAQAEKEECLEQEIQKRYEAQAQILQDQYDSLEQRHKAVIADVARHSEEEKERITEHEKRVNDEIAKTQEERHRLKKEREAVALQKEKEQKREQAIRESLEAQAQVQLTQQRIELEQKHAEAEKELKALYDEKTLQSRIKAETTIRGLLSNAIKSLAEAQQITDHIVSPAMIQAVHDLGGAQHESLLWTIRSLTEALERAEFKLTYGDRDRNIIDAGESLNGHQTR